MRAWRRPEEDTPDYDETSEPLFLQRLKQQFNWEVGGWIFVKITDQPVEDTLSSIPFLGQQNKAGKTDLVHCFAGVYKKGDALHQGSPNHITFFL